MRNSTQSFSTRFYVYFFFSLIILINIFTLKQGHNWGEDFSQYIIHAQNIISSKAYGSGIMVDAPVIYPPGYPLLLAPIIKVFGINFKINYVKSIALARWSN